MAVHPLAVILAALFMAGPLVLAIYIDRQVAAFQREAFGHLAAAARNLRIMVWAVFVYYIAVLAGSAWIGDMRHMFELPMQPQGVQIYIRIGAAIIGYMFALFVARELYLATRPDGRD